MGGSATVPEDFGDLNYEVRLSSSSLVPIEVLFFQEDVTAIKGSDYAFNAQTLTFLPGQTVIAADSVGIIDDPFEEGDESDNIAKGGPGRRPNHRIRIVGRWQR